MAGGSWGLTGIIPSAPVQGTTYSNTFTITISPTWRTQHVNIVGLGTRG